jgi:putative redox protein
MMFQADSVGCTDTPYQQTVCMRNHAITLDVPMDMGGQDRGPTPHELLLAALASCTSITLEMYASRKGWRLGEVRVQVSETVDPQTHEVTFLKSITCSETLSDEQWEKLHIVAEKCPVNQLIQKPITTQIVHNATTSAHTH